jgi:hypothetical protein
MLRKLLLGSALVFRLASSTPVAQSDAPPSKAIRVEKPKNFYIEPNLDVTRPYTSDARFSIVRYG